MLMGFVLTVVRTVLLENIVTIVRNLHHHINVILFFLHDIFFVFLIIKRAPPANMAKTVRFNVLQTAMEHVDTLMDHVQFVREAGRVTIAMKV